MSRNGRPITIRIADGPDDRMLTRKAFQESRLDNDLRFVADGAEVMDGLKRRGRDRDPASVPRPGPIPLDLNMPKKDGRAALEETKADPELRTIRDVVLTTSTAEELMLRSHDLSAVSYKYWLEIVELPGEGNGRDQT